MERALDFILVILKGLWSFDDFRTNKYFVNPASDGHGHFPGEEYMMKQISTVLHDDLVLGWYLADPHNDKVQKAQNSSLVALCFGGAIFFCVFSLIVMAHFITFIKLMISESHIRTSPGSKNDDGNQPLQVNINGSFDISSDQSLNESLIREEDEVRTSSPQSGDHEDC
jgi:hypothetical protein